MRIRFSIAVGVACLGVLFIPTDAVRESNGPKEEAQYIRRLYEDHTVGQTLDSMHPVHAMHILVRSEQPQESTIIATDETERERGRVTTPVTPQDTWIRFDFSPPLSPGKQAITFRTLPDVPKERSVLLRYQSDSRFYAHGYMIVDGEPSYGDLAFRAIERLPFWRNVLLWGNITPDSAIRGGKRISAGLVVGGVLMIAARTIRTTRRPRLAITLFLLLIAAAAIIIRLPVAWTIEGVYGGDAFNYLSKTNALLQGEDFFAADPRKGPLYSLLLILGMFTSDPLAWSRLVGIGAAAGAIALLPLVARRFSLSWEMALGAAGLLAVNQDFIWESPNGLANTLFAVLIVAATLAYLNANDRRWQWALAVLLGMTFLTRYEGGLLSAVYLPALWIRERLSWKRAILLGATTVAIMAIPQLSLLWSGTPGIRTATDVLNDGGLSLAHSVRDYQNNANRFREFSAAVWIFPGEKSLVVPVIVGGLLIGGVLTGMRRRLMDAHVLLGPALAVLSLVVLCILVLGKSSRLREYLSAVPWLLIGIGITPWVATRVIDALAVWGVVVSQIAIVTLILPKPRYYLHLIPLLALGMAFGVQHLAQWRNSWYPRAVAALTIGILTSVFYVDGQKTLEGRIEKYNKQAQHVYVMMQAVKDLRRQSQPAGFRTPDEPPIVVYLPTGRRFFFTDTEESGVGERELQWIQENNVWYVVERNEGNVWQSVREHPDLFEHPRIFVSTFGNARVSVYGVHRDRVQAFFTAREEPSGAL